MVTNINHLQTGLLGWMFNNKINKTWFGLLDRLFYWQWCEHYLLDSRNESGEYAENFLPVLGLHVNWIHCETVLKYVKVENFWSLASYSLNLLNNLSTLIHYCYRAYLVFSDLFSFTEHCSVTDFDQYAMNIQYELPLGSYKSTEGYKPPQTVATFTCKHNGFASQTTKCQLGEWSSYELECLRG